jgi:NADPH2:quinone reductase
VGQRVGAITVYGSHADHLCVPVGWLVPVPLDADQAEALVVVFNYVTAYQMLHRTARVRANERLLVHGAAGGIGSAVLQLGRLLVSRYTAPARAPTPGASPLWAQRPIDYTKEDFLTRVRELTGKGVDVVLDGIGGAVSLRSYRALRRGGCLVMFGHYSTTVAGRKNMRRMAIFYLAGAMVFAANLIPDGRRVQTFQVAKLQDRHPDWFRGDVLALFELLQQGKIEPIVAERIPLTEAARAHENLGRGGIVGKQVLICDPGLDSEATRS